MLRTTSDMTKQAINTKTQEEYDALMEYYKAKDVTFRGGGYPKYKKYQEEYGVEMCIVWNFLGDKRLSVGSASFYDQRGYEIIPYTEFAKANIVEEKPKSRLFDPKAQQPIPSEDCPEFSVDVFIIDEKETHGLACYHFEDKKWIFHTDTLVDYNEKGAETQWRWYYPDVQWGEESAEIDYKAKYEEAVKLLEWSKQICSNIQRTKTYGTKFPETGALGSAIEDFFENTREEEIEITKELLEPLGFTRLPLEKYRDSYLGRSDLNFGYPVLFLNKHTYLSINASEPTGYVFLNGLRIKCKTVCDLKKLYFALTGNVLKSTNSKSIKMSEIIWTGSPDDQTARINDYILRVEQMDRYYWWWAVSYQGEEIATDGKQTKEQAKTACEKAYYEHLKTK